MSRHIATTAMLAVLCVAMSAAAESPGPGELFKRMRWARLEIVSSRVTMTQLRLGQQSTVTCEDPETGSREVLRLAARSADRFSLYYEYSGNEACWRLEVDRGNRVQLDRNEDAEGVWLDVRYSQPADGPVHLLVKDGVQTTQVQASSFWHLMLSEPDLCQQYLVPSLQAFRSGWRLDRQAARIEAELLELARESAWSDRERWAQLVKQLAAARFQQRQAAHRELLESGQRLAPYLATLDESRLTVEQRTRIRQLRKRLSLRSADTPERVANWLAEDQEAWLALVDRNQAPTRILAAQRLQRLAEEPFDFDPQGSESQRAEQLVRLRQTLGLVSPPLLGARAPSTTLR